MFFFIIMYHQFEMNRANELLNAGKSRITRIIIRYQESAVALPTPALYYND